MSHYFVNDPNLRHAQSRVQLTMDGEVYEFETDAGVFSKQHLDSGSALLIRSAPPLAGHAVDLGCGWGPVGIILARKNPGSRLSLVDVNERAVALAARNILQNGADNAQALVSDGLSALSGPLDAVISNPPVRIGKQAMYHLFEQAHEKLRPGGFLCIVIRKAQGAPSCKQFLSELFGNCQTIARESGFHILLSVKSSPGEEAV